MDLRSLTSRRPFFGPCAQVQYYFTAIQEFLFCTIIHQIAGAMFLKRYQAHSSSLKGRLKKRFAEGLHWRTWCEGREEASTSVVVQDDDALTLHELYIGPVRFAEKTSWNTVLADLLWEKNIVLAEKK